MTVNQKFKTVATSEMILFIMSKTQVKCDRPWIHEKRRTSFIPIYSSIHASTSILKKIASLHMHCLIRGNRTYDHILSDPFLCQTMLCILDFNISNLFNDLNISMDSWWDVYCINQILRTVFLALIAFLWCDVIP